MRYDLLLTNGTVVDPSQGVFAKRDVGFSGGKVAAVGDGLSASQANEIVDCRDRYVSPGFIDLHVHTFWGVSHYGMDDVDRHCLARGATTVVDAGSAGADTYAGFRRYVIDTHATRIFGLLHVSRTGMLSSDYADITRAALLDVDRATAVVAAHRDTIVGIKVRLTRDEAVGDPALGLQPLERAAQLARAVGLPLMVHPLDAVGADTIDPLLEVLDTGDILTHCFHAYRCGILDDAGRVRDAVWRAVKRGVRFDVGHGRSSFSWGVAEAALEQGFVPAVISSDLHAYNLDGPVVDLPTTATKFLYLGMALDEVIARMTVTPAAALGRPDELGTLAVGARGDAVVFAIETGRFDLFDSSSDVNSPTWKPGADGHDRRTAGQRLTPVAVVAGGRMVGQSP